MVFGFCFVYRVHLKKHVTKMSYLKIHKYFIFLICSIFFWIICHCHFPRFTFFFWVSLRHSVEFTLIIECILHLVSAYISTNYLLSFVIMFFFSFSLFFKSICFVQICIVFVSVLNIVEQSSIKKNLVQLRTHSYLNCIRFVCVFFFSTKMGIGTDFIFLLFIVLFSCISMNEIYCHSICLV